MLEVLLLCSVHKENGKCNSRELVRIFESIEPDVLFQEIPYFNFLENNNLGNGNILEVSAISEYLENHEVRQVPVDTLGGSTFEPTKYDQVINRVLHAGPELRVLLEQQNYLQHNNGFDYINSRMNDSMLRCVDLIISKALERLKDEKLSIAYCEWKNYNSNREDEMIDNLYEFSEYTNYKKGVFLFGSGHRQSLIRKIQKTKKYRKVQITWRLYRSFNRIGVPRE